MMANFDHYSKYYDLLYKDKNYEAESNYVINKINHNTQNCKTILELGSGSANHAKYFCENAFDVTGIEQSESMIKESLSKKIKGFDVIHGNIVETNIDKKFDCALALFHVISYLSDNQSLIKCFKNIHNHLKDSGIFIFDVWYSQAVYDQKPQIRIKRLENDEIKITRITESTMISEKNIVNVNFEVIIEDKRTNQLHTFKELHPMRYFSIPEIELFAHLTGFQLLNTEEFLTGMPPTSKTWGVCFTLKKL